jgi:hypothetical protein
LKISLQELANYPLPDFLKGRCTHRVYIKWLNNKADTLLKRDKRRGKTYARAASESDYKKEIHKAVINGGESDPYTGEPLTWELISTWDSTKKHSEGYKAKFAFMPTVDHITVNALHFEICSWQTNEAKSDVSPEKFIKFCEKVATFRGKARIASPTSNAGALGLGLKPGIIIDKNKI